MRIKKHTSGNEYLSSNNVWIRNFAKKCHFPVQLSHMLSEDDYEIVVANEEFNKSYPKISNETIIFKKIVIVSDGFDFDKTHRFLSKLPKDVCILAVNKALLKWKLIDNDIPVNERKTINAFVINNPYEEAMLCMPSRYYPACLASTRSNHQFLSKYKGDIYTYCPTPETAFGLYQKEVYYIDDYRNPICAAIGLSYRFGVEKLLLVCCDDSFEDKRESSILMPNGLYAYPQQLKSQKIIDANLHWLIQQEDREIVVGDYSKGPEYLNAEYISDEEEALTFFQDEGPKEEGITNG